MPAKEPNSSHRQGPDKLSILSSTKDSTLKMSSPSKSSFTSYRYLIDSIRDSLSSSAQPYRPLLSNSNSKSSPTKSTLPSSSSNKSNNNTNKSHLTLSNKSSPISTLSPSSSSKSTKIATSSWGRTMRTPSPSNNSSTIHNYHSHQPYSILFILFHLFLFSSILHQSTAQSCGYPGSPAHAIVSMSPPQGPITSGTIATYTCNNGYELLGPARRVCNENGTWTPLGIPFCVLNVAVGKAAMQSSSVGQGTAQKAIDGSTSTFYNPSTCSMTEAEAQPWFYVNLLEPVLVQLVRIDFGASCCGRNPATITVRVGNYRPDMGQNPVCNKFTGYIEEGRPLFLPCARPMPGAFVSITLESDPVSRMPVPLSICEMFVYTDHALSIEQCPSFRDQHLGSTSTYNGNCYLFYNHQPMTFNQAKVFCEKRGGSLVNQISPALQGFLSWELYRRHKNDKNGQYWLGVVRDQHNPNNWKWINGKDVTLSFWNLPGSNENCSRFDGTKGFLWSDTPCNTKLNFMCQHRPLSCGKPERPVNSTVLASSTDVGSTIEYKCGEGSMLIGPSLRTCLPNGFFSEFSPKCKYVECGFPASIANGHYMLKNNSLSYQSTLAYHCQDGYVLVGRANLACDADSKWNGPPPRCEPVLCPPPPMIVNGYLTTTSNSTMFGSVVEYTCDPGYEMMGERSITCNIAGYWDGQPGYCLESAPPSPSTTTTTTTTTTTPSTTTSQTTQSSSVVPSTTLPPTTFFTRGQQQNTGIWSTPDHSTKRPTIVLLPTSSTSSSSSNTNPYTRGDSSSSSISSTSFVPNTTPSTNIFSSSVTTSAPTRSSISNTQSTRRQPGGAIRPVQSTPKPGSFPPNHLNEIPGADTGFGGKPSPSRIASARLNMGGIIALGVFGGFVFLAAVITIIVIIIRSISSKKRTASVSTFWPANTAAPGSAHVGASPSSRHQDLQRQQQQAAAAAAANYRRGSNAISSATFVSSYR